MTPVVLAAAAVGAVLLGATRGATPGAKPVDAGDSPQGTPPAQPAGSKVKRCEPADTWFEETTGHLMKSNPPPANESASDKAKRVGKAEAKAKAYGVTEDQWNKLSCSEKKQVMALGPLALNTILLGRGYEEAKKQLKKLSDAAGNAANAPSKTINSAAKAVKKISPF